MADDSIIDKYNRNAASYAKSSFGREDKGKLAQFTSLLEKHATILDIGCAAGRDTEILSDMGFSVVGADLAEKLLAIARESYPNIEFILADMRNLPFSDNSFDAIWANAVLHHVSKEEMPQALKEFCRVLAHHGVLFVHTKAGKGVLSTKDASVSDEERDFTLLTTRELDQMLITAGFSKLSLEENASRSRPGLKWLSGFYRKST